ncbi:hypothetical protein PB72LOC_03346 [Pectobacterium atrosepticum]|nr:hypothetical protein PB72LOC_03346 [Pectobacterium atrosepticum]
MGQKRDRVCIVEHISEAFGRIGWVQWHIGGTGLQNPQQPDHHVWATFETNRDAVIGFYAERKQMVCQPVGPAIEFVISDVLFFEHDGGGIRRLFHLCLKE